MAMSEARMRLFLLAGGGENTIEQPHAAEIQASLFDAERDRARLVRRIEQATTDLQAQADRLVAQVVSEEQRANRLQREADRWRAAHAKLRGRVRRMHATIRANREGTR